MSEYPKHLGQARKRYAGRYRYYLKSSYPYAPKGFDRPSILGPYPALNDDTVFFPDELQILDGILILDLAVGIIIEGDLGDIQLNQAP